MSRSKASELQEERKQMIDQVFDMFDKDGSGEIDVSEVKGVLTSMGRKPDDKAVNEFLKFADVDKSKTISKKEFLRAMNEMYSIGSDEVEQCVEAFQVFDRDHSGKISRDEMKNILMKYGKDFTESECEEIFDLLDLNKDGEIDYAEFTELWKFQ